MNLIQKVLNKNSSYNIKGRHIYAICPYMPDSSKADSHTNIICATYMRKALTNRSTFQSFSQRKADP